MKFEICRASNYGSNKPVTINSLEELEELQRKEGHRLVIDFDEKLIVIADDFLDNV